MTPACDTCQLDFRPGEDHDAETWEREAVLRCIPCAREFAQIRQFLDGPGVFDALEDALASPLAAEIDARAARYPAPGGAPTMLLTSTPGGLADGFIPGPVQIGPGYFPGGVTIHSRSRPHG